jgi:hypothetical protein
VVWQGFDGDDFEIYLYDIDKGRSTPIKLTTNNYDDTNPEIHDDPDRVDGVSRKLGRGNLLPRCEKPSRRIRTCARSN